MSKELIAQAVAAGHAKHSGEVTDYGFLGDGNGTVINDLGNRIVNYYQEAPDGGKRTVSTAPLSETSNIPLANISVGTVIPVALGYPLDNGPFSVLFQTSATGTAGYTLQDQRTNNTQFPQSSNIQDWRATPLPGFIEVQIALGHYIQLSTKKPFNFTGDTRFADTSMTTRVAALAAGKHQICWIFFDEEAGILRTAVSTAATPAGSLPAPLEFTTADFQSVALPNSNCKFLIPVYLYYGQTGTLLASHIYYNWDHRFDFPLQGAGGGAGANTALSNLASVAVNTSLISDTDNTDDLGTAAIRWKNTYSVNVLGDLGGRRIRNGSGATANAGDVGYITYDATYGLIYNTTTTANFIGDWCAVVVGGANGADIYITKSGPMVLNYSGSAPAAGEFLTLGTSAGKVVTNASMRHEVVAIATAAGSGGTVAVKLLINSKTVSAINSNDLWTVVSQSDTLWTGTINGAPTATSVTLTTATGNLNCINQNAAGQLMQLRLRNITRGTYRLVTAVNTGTGVVTTVNTVDAWANTDSMTVESGTVTSGLAYKQMDLDMKTAIDAGTLPRLMRALNFITQVNDTSTTASAFLRWHPFETYSATKTQNVQSIPVASAYGFLNGVLPIIGGVVTMGCDASGAATATVACRLAGYILACE